MVEDDMRDNVLDTETNNEFGQTIVVLSKVLQDQPRGFVTYKDITRIVSF